MNPSQNHPQKFRRLKGYFTSYERLKSQIASCALVKFIVGYVVDDRQNQVYVALNEQKDWKLTSSFDFLESITHWSSNESLENFAKKHNFLYYPLHKDTSEKSDQKDSGKGLVKAESSSLNSRSKKIQKLRKLLSLRKEREDPRRLAKRKELDKESEEKNFIRCNYWKRVIEGGELDLFDLVAMAGDKNGVDWACSFLRKNKELLTLNNRVQKKNSLKKKSFTDAEDLF